MKRVVYTSIVVICVFGVVVFAQKKRLAKDPCKDPMSQAEMNLCSRRDYEKADVDLNKVYKQLKLEVAGYETNHRPKFEEAQSLWLKYRDANCDSEASIYEGGSIRPTIYYSCLASLTKERTNRIKAFVVEIK